MNLTKSTNVSLYLSKFILKLKYTEKLWQWIVMHTLNLLVVKTDFKLPKDDLDENNKSKIHHQDKIELHR